jgi:hypothetical protein
MPLRATKDKSGHCPRCREDVRTVRPWPHWRKVRYGYFGVLGCALFGSPVLLCDGFVLIPTLMLFMVAIGPLNSLIGKPITCAQCGGPVDPLRHLRAIAGSADAKTKPWFFRKRKRMRDAREARAASKAARTAKLVQLRQENVRNRDGGADRHEQQAAPE